MDIFSYIVNIRPSDPQWIGAWWSGFLICGTLLFLLAFPFLSFPRILVKEKRKVLEQKCKEDLLDEDEKVSRHGEEYGKTIRGEIHIVDYIHHFLNCNYNVAAATWKKGLGLFNLWQ